MTKLIKEPTKEELTKGDFTNRIRINETQTKQSLLQYGFTNHNKPVLYFMKMIDKHISFNLSVCGKTLSITGIDVLDEEWIQPYDYQYEILNGHPSSKALNTYNKVNNVLSKLQRDNIINGFEEGMYI